MDDVPTVMKRTRADLCKDHWPEEGVAQPNNCKRVEFVWPEGGPPDPPFTSNVTANPVTDYFIGPFFEEGYDGPVFKEEVKE